MFNWNLFWIILVVVGTVAGITLCIVGADMSDSSNASSSSSTSDTPNAENTDENNTGGIIDDIFGEDGNGNRNAKKNNDEETVFGNQKEVEDDSSESSVEIQSTLSFDETMESGETIDIVDDDNSSN